MSDCSSVKMVIQRLNPCTITKASKMNGVRLKAQSSSRRMYRKTTAMYIAVQHIIIHEISCIFILKQFDDTSNLNINLFGGCEC